MHEVTSAAIVEIIICIYGLFLDFRALGAINTPAPSAQQREIHLQW